MSKYSNLPDIDRGVDVFETPDEPDAPLKPSEDLSLDDDAPAKAPSTEGIDGSKLPERRRAEKVFGRSRRKDGTVQYGLPGLQDDISDEEDHETYTLKENPTARLHRLKRELAELESEMGNAEAGPSSLPPPPSTSSAPGGRVTRKSVLPPKPPVDLIGEIGGLRSRITEVELKSDEADSASNGMDGKDWHERLRDLGKGSARPNGDASGGEKTRDGGESSFKPPLTSAPPAAGLGELDKRLAALEELVGPLGEGSDQAQAPLLDTVSKLDHLLLLLTQPRHLDAISRRVKLLLVDLDRAATAARRAPTTSSAPAAGSTSSSVTLNAGEYAQLQSLFAILPRLDPMLPILPPLLARLRSLASLHAQAGDVAEGLRKLSAEDQRSGEEVKELGQVVEEVKKGLEEGAKGIERNWEALNTRMKGLEERIQKL